MNSDLARRPRRSHGSCNRSAEIQIHISCPDSDQRQPSCPAKDSRVTGPLALTRPNEETRQRAAGSGVSCQCWKRKVWGDGVLTLNSVKETEAEACLVPLVCAILSRCQGQDGNSDRLYKGHYLLLVEGSWIWAHLDDLVRLLA